METKKVLTDAINDFSTRLHICKYVDNTFRQNTSSLYLFSTESVSFLIFLHIRGKAEIESVHILKIMPAIFSRVLIFNILLVCVMYLIQIFRYTKYEWNYLRC